MSGGFVPQRRKAGPRKRSWIDGNNAESNSYPGTAPGRGGGIFHIGSISGEPREVDSDGFAQLSKFQKKHWDSLRKIHVQHVEVKPTHSRLDDAVEPFIHCEFTQILQIGKMSGEQNHIKLVNFSKVLLLAPTH